MYISLIIPCFNEEKIVYGTIKRALFYMKTNYKSFEIIAVNDGSTDNTLQILNKFSNEIKIISYPKNRGKGYAVRKGVFCSKGQYVFFTDADLSYSLSNLSKAIDILEKSNADIVLGCRGYERTSYSELRRFLSVAFNRFVKAVLDFDFGDTQCGFKGFKRNLAKKIFNLIHINGFGFDFELLYYAKKFNAKVETFNVNFRHNPDSHVNIIIDPLKMIYQVLEIKILDFKERRFGKGV